MNDYSTKKHLEALIIGKHNEIKMNETFMKMKTTNFVLFGDIVQLRHVKSGKFVTIRPNELARDERENLCVYLSADGSQLSWLQLLPRLKIDREGDKILANTEMLLRVAERQQEFLHCSEKEPPSGKLREVNSSIEYASPWRMSIYQSSRDTIDEKKLLIGQLISIRDPETQSFLCPFELDQKSASTKKESAPKVSNADSGSDASEDESEDEKSVTSVEEYKAEFGDVVLKPMDMENLDTNALWLMEAKGLIKGGPIMWKSGQVHLRHLNSGKYLCIQTEELSDKTIFIMTNTLDKSSLFQINELHSSNEFLSDSKAIQLRNGHMILERGDYSDRHKVFSCNGTRHKMKAASLILNRYMQPSEDKMHQNEPARAPLDVHVGISSLDNLTKFLEVTSVPPVKATGITSIWTSLNTSDKHIFTTMIERIIRFVQGFPVLIDPNLKDSYKVNKNVIRRRQNMFREQGLLAVILQMLEKLIPIADRSISGDAAPQQYAEGGLLFVGRAVISDCLKLLKEIVKDNSANQMNLADNMLIILAHVSIDPIAAAIAREMFGSNRELQETKIGPKEFNIFAERMRESEFNSMYLKLIHACCSTNGLALPKNQTSVSKILFDKCQDILVSVKIEYDSNSPAVALPSTIISNELYLPAPNSVYFNQMLGKAIVLKGIPNVLLTWSASSRDLQPQELYGKKYVNVLDLYRIIIKGANQSQKSGASIKVNPGGDKGKLVADFFVAQLNLAAEMCLGRNYQVISMMENLYKFDMLFTIMRSNITDAIKGAAARLITYIYIDRDPQILTTLPRLTRTLTECSKTSVSTILSVDEERVHYFGLLQAAISEEVKQLKGKPFGQFSLSIMLMLKYLLSYNFYGNKEKLSDIVDPLVNCLVRQKIPFDDVLNVVEEVLVISAPIRLKKQSRRNSISTLQNTKSEKNFDGSKEGENNSSDEARLMANTAMLKLFKSILNYMESLPHLYGMLAIVVVAIALVIYDFVTPSVGLAVHIVEYIIIAIFIIEVSLRGISHYFVRAEITTFWTDFFNQVDVAIVLIDIVILSINTNSGSGSGFVKALRVLRFLRLFRVMRLMRAYKLLTKMVKMTLNVTSTWVEPKRYSNTCDVAIKTMVTIIEILSFVQMIIADTNMSNLLRDIYMWQSVENPNMDDCVTIFRKTCDNMKELEVSNDAYDDIYIDLLMYGNTEVVQGALHILMNHHSTKRTLLKNIQRVQLLVSDHREQQYVKIESHIKRLKHEVEMHDIWGKLTKDEHVKINKDIFSIFEDLITACRKKRSVLCFDEIYEPDRTTQDILRNLGCLDICIKVLTLHNTIDPNESLNLVNKNTKSLVATCNILLYWFILDNNANQQIAFTNLQFFIKTIDAKINSHKVINAIFSNNEYLMKITPKKVISEFASFICTIGRFPQYLSLLGAVVSAGDKNIIENQYEVIRLISSPSNQRKVVLFFTSVTHPDYAKKVKLMSQYINKKDVLLDDLPSDLAYHMELMSVLSRCTIGRANMTTIEAKVQSLFHFVDVVQAILDPNSILLAKIRLGLFLYNAVLEVEMRLPSLKDAACIWELLVSTQDIFTFSKDELRQVEKNGLSSPTTHRQKLEYMIVCAKIVYGYFEFYFDRTIYRSDMGSSAMGVERMQYRENQCNEIIRNIFSGIKGVYDMQSPILDSDHQDILYKALLALNKCASEPIVAYVEKLHQDKSTILANQKKEKSTNENFNLFVENLLSNEGINQDADDEVQGFIAKLSSLPLKNDPIDADVRFEPLIARLVDHIRDNIQVVVYGDESSKFMSDKNTQIAIWLMKIFRTMIENKWGMSIDERDDDGGEEQDIAAASIMTILNECGATALCLDLIAKGIEIPLQAEAIKLLVALLFKEGGALDVQKSINRHLSKSGSDLFFLHIRLLINNLINWHKWNGVVVLEEGQDPTLPPEIILIRMLQLMCEGHFQPNQDIMREQPNNFVQVNLLDDFVSYLQALDGIKCRTSTVAALRVGATILEVIQGPCVGNQDHFALNTELLETLNRKMRHQPVNDCVEEEEIELKKTAVDIFQALLEGQVSKTAIYERMLSVIHLDVIQMLGEPPADDVEDSDEAQELRTECLVLLQMLSDFKPELRSELGLDNSASSMTDMHIGCVEVMWRDELQRRVFHIPDICDDLSSSSKEYFKLNVNRKSVENKLYGLYEAAKVIYREILHQQFLREWNVDKVFSPEVQDKTTWTTFVLACCINFLYLLFYKNVEVDCPVGSKLETCFEPYINPDAAVAITVLNILNILTASFTLVIFIVVKIPVNFQTNQALGHSFTTSVMNTVLDAYTLYYFLYLIIAIVGTVRANYLLPFLLFDIITKNDALRNVLMAFYIPKKQVALTIVLTWIVTYIYAMFYFMVFNDPKSSEDDPHYIIDDGNNALTLVNTVKWFIRYGSETGSLNTYNDVTVTVVSIRYLLEVSYFVIMFIMLNVIKGITIDTFVELRLNLLARIKDTEEVCFICGIDKLVFNRALDRNAFNNHVKYDQNLWHYIYFIIYIWEQDKDDDDGLEYYVRHLINASDLSWFPMNKAIRLMEHQNKKGKTNMNAIVEQNLIQTEKSLENKISNFKDHLLRSLSRVEHSLVLNTEHNSVRGNSTAKEEEKKINIPVPPVVDVKVENNSYISLSVDAYSPGAENFKATHCRLISEEATYTFPPQPIGAKDKGLSYWGTGALTGSLILRFNTAVNHFIVHKGPLERKEIVRVQLVTIVQDEDEHVAKITVLHSTDIQLSHLIEATKGAVGSMFTVKSTYHMQERSVTVVLTHISPEYSAEYTTETVEN